MAHRGTGAEEGNAGRAAAAPPPVGGPEPGLSRAELGGRALGAGLLASAAAHLLVWSLGPELRLPAPDSLRAEQRMVALPPADEPTPPAVEVPAAPDPIPRPAEPVASESTGSAATPSPPPFIPHDVRPKLLNPSFVRDYLDAFYPPSLRTTEMEAQIRLWLFVNERGDVEEVRIRSSSGLAEFDDLVVDAASIMDFRPAVSGDTPVGVWVEQGIRFQVVPPGPGSGRDEVPPDR